MATNKWRTERRTCRLSSCKKEFMPETPQQFYCTTKCRDLKYTAKKAWQVERKCKLQSCSTPFAATHYRQSFCHKDCHKKSISSDFPEKKCGVKHCNNIFKPRHRHGKYCSPDCLQYARRPLNHAAALASQKRSKKGAYMTDEQFRQKALATLVLKCTQIVCAPDCRIRGMERLGCVA